MHRIWIVLEPPPSQAIQGSACLYAAECVLQIPCVLCPVHCVLHAGHFCLLLPYTVCCPLWHIGCASIAARSMVCVKGGLQYCADLCGVPSDGIGPEVRVMTKAVEYLCQPERTSTRSDATRGHTGARSRQGGALLQGQQPRGLQVQRRTAVPRRPTSQGHAT